MTESSSKTPPRRKLAPLAGLIALPLVAALVLYFGVLARNGEAVARECAAQAETLARIAPLARGELAALAVHSAPKTAPTIAFAGPDGAKLSLGDFAGKTVLVNLWATWCAPCRHEMPALDKLQAELGGPDFEVVAINIDTRNPEKARTWLAENGIARLAYYAENEGTLLQTLQRSGHVVGLPTTVLFGPNGCELAVLKGPAEWASEDALALMRAALGRDGAPRG